jgi:hypothetical protein
MTRIITSTYRYKRPPRKRKPVRCPQCGTDRTDFVVTSRDNPQPW